ncbi:hypothetical protein [Streptomyces avicenniae]|uniref:hypothetical protein n=1 Tax=Streptomyces avicenniae TaxID=500153 RepID=UPI000A992DCA|nr:hypothetical protein [Streptomyces avicenniae]
MRSQVSLPDWLPYDGRVRARPLGEWFDAVRVPEFQGLYAFARLQAAGRGGPVVEDRVRHLLYWLVPPGTAGCRDWPRGVRALGRGHILAVPPADRVGEPWAGEGEAQWVMYRPSGRCLTDPDVLHAALTRVFGAVGTCG